MVKSEEHEKLTEQIVKEVNGIKVVIRGNNNIRGQYFPDIKLNDVDIECEIVPRRSWIETKIRKWDNSKKKILVLSIQKFTFDNFDEIWFWDIQKNRLVAKIK